MHEKQQQRRNRIRNYVRFVVEEHKSMKAMGITGQSVFFVFPQPPPSLMSSKLSSAP
jgi:hypothetical protein